MTHTAQACFECDFCGVREAVTPARGTIAEDAPLPDGWQNMDGPSSLDAVGFADGYAEFCGACAKAVAEALAALRDARRQERKP